MVNGVWLWGKCALFWFWIDKVCISEMTMWLKWQRLQIRCKVTEYIASGEASERGQQSVPLCSSWVIYENRNFWQRSLTSLDFSWIASPCTSPIGLHKAFCLTGIQIMAHICATFLRTYTFIRSTARAAGNKVLLRRRQSLFRASLDQAITLATTSSLLLIHTDLPLFSR